MYNPENNASTSEIFSVQKLIDVRKMQPINNRKIDGMYSLLAYVVFALI
jgi:hypothetical protein